MSKRRTSKKRENHVKTDGWIATFGDLTSLMLTFFVLMLSMSSINKASLKQIRNPVQIGGIGILSGGSSGTGRLSLQERLLVARLQAIKIIKNSPWRHKIHVLIIDKKMLLRLPSTLLFEPGHASLKPVDITMLKRLAALLQAMPGSIRVEGHTYRENLVPTTPYRSARELSLARAASVLHVLQKAGIDDKRLSLAGYGDAHPVTLNVTPMDIARNRRVDIVLYQDADKDMPAKAITPQTRS